MGIFEDEDVSIYDHFTMNSGSEDDGKEKIKAENKTKDVENSERRIGFDKEKEIKIKEERTEKEPLVKDIKREEVSERKTEQSTDEMPQDKDVGDVIEKRKDEYKDISSSRHQEKKRKREDGGKKCKKIKHKIKTSDSDKYSQKKSRHRTRDDDCVFEIEEKEKHKKVKKYHSPSPRDNYYEEDYMKEIKKENDNRMLLAISIKQEFPLMYGAYLCDVCNLTLNSHITYQSHVTGKKHKKKLDAINAAQDAAKSYVPIELTSKSPNDNETNDLSDIPSTSSIQYQSFKMPSTSSKDQLSSSKQGVDFCELFKSFCQPDPSKAGFYCTICNSYSNSSSMWEAHIIGKRHIANLKKAPGIAPSKSQNFPAPSGTVARLYSHIKNIYEPIVGLDQIREIQRLDVDSVSYTCFLCGGNSISEEEIVDHILLTKHREKYLEKISYPEFEDVRYCQMSVRCSVIGKLCEKVEAEKGRGEPEVYYAKISDSLVRMQNKL